MKPVLRVFISATTTDLLWAREVTKNALLTAGILPVVQENFPPDPRALQDFLRQNIALCDAVVCLVGQAFGAVATNEAGQPLSFAHLEYETAQRLRKPTYILLSEDDSTTAAPGPTNEQERQLQLTHRNRLQQAHKCERFRTAQDLSLRLADLIPALRGRFQASAMFFLHPPSAAPYFAGREEELQQLTEALEAQTPAVVVVLGMGGIGKTTLVHQWLRVEGRLPFASGFWCTAYRGGFNFDMFLDAALQHLVDGGNSKSASRSVEERITDLLGLLQVRPALVVIDGAERWLQGAHAATAAIAGADAAPSRQANHPGFDRFLREVTGLANGSHVLLTTRTIPAALDDVEHRVLPVYRQSDQNLAMRGLAPPAAIELLVRLGVKGEPTELRAVAETYGFHPLALNVLGGLIARKHGGILRKLPSGRALEPAVALRQLLDEIRRELPGGGFAQALLVVVSLCFEDPLLETVAAGLAPHPPKEALLEQAVALAEWHLAAFDPAAERLKLHPLIKQFFGALPERSEATGIHQRLAGWYAAQSIPAAPARREDVRTRLLAIEHALAAGLGTWASELFFARLGPAPDTPTFAEWLATWGHQTSGAELLRRLAEATPAPARTECRTVRGAFLRQLGRLDEALEDLSRATGDFAGQPESVPAERLPSLAGALSNKGNILAQMWRLAEAIPCFEAALGVLGRLPGSQCELELQRAGVHLNRAAALRDQGRLTKALKDYQTAVRIYRSLMKRGDHPLETNLSRALTGQANILSDLERHTEALAEHDDALRLLEAPMDAGKTEFRSLVAAACSARARTLTELDRCNEATADLDRSIELQQRLVEEGRTDLEPSLALTWLSRSETSLRQRKWQRARDDANRVIETFQRLIAEGGRPFRGWLAGALLNRSQAEYALGLFDESAADRQRGLDLLHALILAGEPETRIGLLNKSVDIVRDLAAREPEVAIGLLQAAVREAEQGIADGVSAEALIIEARRGMRLLQADDVQLLPATRESLIGTLKTITPGIE